MQLILTPQEGGALYGLLADHTSDIIFRTDRRGFIVHASAGLERLGIALPGMLVGPQLADLVEPAMAEAIREAHRAVVTGARESAGIEFSRPLAGGQRGHFLMQMRALASDDGRIAGTLGVLRDIGEQRCLEERLFAAEMTDALTGLTNRRAFTAMLAHLTAQPGDHGLALLDVDHFRAINSRHGAHTGDEVLIAVAEFLRAALSAREPISRVGGGRFAVLLPATPVAAAEAACREIVGMIEEISRAASGGTFPITASAGLTHVGRSADAAIDRAETALFMARASGGNRLVTHWR